MAYAFFKIRTNDDGSEMERLNGFLRAHRILTVRNEWVAAGEESFWAFCIDYLEPGKQRLELSRSGRGERIDYKEVLSPEDFAVFARLREKRKQLAEADGVPVFTIFTNEHLAEMVRRKCQNITELRKIEGIGEARAEKHGNAMLTELKRETGGRPEGGQES